MHINSNTDQLAAHEGGAEVILANSQVQVQMDSEDNWLQELQELKLSLLDDNILSLRKTSFRASAALVLVVALALLWLSTGPDPAETIVRVTKWLFVVLLGMLSAIYLATTFKLRSSRTERGHALAKGSHNPGQP